MDRNHAQDLVIRRAGPADAAAIARLAQLDDAPPPGPADTFLLAEVGGELWAAVAVDGAPAIADPFRPSAAVAELLVAWSGQAAATNGRRGRLAALAALARGAVRRAAPAEA
jgi:hypothetical protein